MTTKLPTGWKLEQLGDVASIVMGQSPSSSTYNDNQRGLPFFQGKAEFGKRYPTPKKYCSEPIRIAEFNDILMSVRAPVGPVNLSPGKCCFGRGLCAIRANEKLDQLYLFFYLRSIEHILSQQGQGSTFEAIGRNQVEEINIVYPTSKGTQREIVSVLEKADQVKALREDADELMKGYLWAIFSEMFASYTETEILGDHILFMTSGSRGWAKYYAENGDLFLRIENVGRNQLLLDDLTFVNAPKTQEAERTNVKPGDVLLSITADLGRTCVIPPKFPKAFVNQHLAILRLDQNLNPIFVAQYLTSSRGMSQINRLDKGGTKAGLNFADIRSIRIPLPPLKLQGQFANIVYQVEKLKEMQKQSRFSINNLFNSLKQKAFRGELAC